MDDGRDSGRSTNRDAVAPRATRRRFMLGVSSRWERTTRLGAARVISAIDSCVLPLQSAPLDQDLIHRCTTRMKAEA